MIGNQSPFMSKTTILTIKLRNAFLKIRTEESRRNCTKLRNQCVSLLKETKMKCYRNLDYKIRLYICNNIKFWKNGKPRLASKINCNENLTLIEESKITKTDKKTA